MFYSETALRAVKAKRDKNGLPYGWAIYQMYLGRLMGRYGNCPRLF